MGEIGRIRKDIEREDIWLDSADAISTQLHIMLLRSQRHFVFYKDKLDPPPEGSDLAEDLFILYIQTKFQWNAF